MPGVLEEQQGVLLSEGKVGGDEVWVEGHLFHGNVGRCHEEAWI